MTAIITQYFITCAQDKETDTHIPIYDLLSFNLVRSLSLFSVALSHSQLFLDSLSTMFHSFIFQQRVKDSWRKAEMG